MTRSEGLLEKYQAIAPDLCKEYSIAIQQNLAMEKTVHNIIKTLEAFRDTCPANNVLLEAVDAAFFRP